MFKISWLTWLLILSVALKVLTHKRKKSYRQQPAAVKLSLLSALEQHNMKPELAEPMEIKLLFKKKPGIRTIYFRVDEQEQFCEVSKCLSY